MVKKLSIAIKKNNRLQIELDIPLICVLYEHKSSPFEGGLPDFSSVQSSDWDKNSLEVGNDGYSSKSNCRLAVAQNSRRQYKNSHHGEYAHQFLHFCPS